MRYIQLQENAYNFAAAKVIALKNILKTADKAESERQVKLFKQRLEVETEAFQASAQAAQQWQDIQDDIEDFPYLKFITAGDEFVRPSHKALNGTVLPVGHVFWITHFIPLGYRCRCAIIQVTKKEYNKIPKEKKKLPPLPEGVQSFADNPAFQNNPGLTGLAITNKHPYFKDYKANNEFSKRFADFDKTMVSQKEYASYNKDTYSLDYFNPETGGYVTTHTKHGKDEYKSNFEAAKILADQEGHRIILLPSDVEKKTILEIIPKDQFRENKFPDSYLVDLGIVIDLKDNKEPTYNAIKKALYKGKEQASVILLNIKSGINISVLKKSVADRVRQSSKIKEVWFVLDGKLHKVKNNDIIAGKWPF